MPDEKGNVLEVNIGGNVYLLRGEEDIAHMQEVADIVDAKLRFVRRKFPQYSKERSAILTALQIADELIKKKDQYTRLREEVSLPPVE